MKKITHISTQRKVQTKNWERRVYEVIVDWHQITLWRPLGKVVNVGDEIEYIKNEKGFYVEKSKKDEMKELVSKVAELEKRVEKLENIYSSTKKSDGE